LLYEVLAIVDILRAGKNREVKIGLLQLKKILSSEPSPKHN
jgi:hypothetical protein